MTAYEQGLNAGRRHGFRIGGKFCVYENPYSITQKEHYEWEGGFSDGWCGK